MDKRAEISGGATIWARQTIDSEIFYDKPDKWFKIWFFLVNRVNHKPYRKWKRGECHVTYKEIMVKTKATKSQVDHCIRYLKRDQMLATRKATRGMHLTIDKYCTYQDFDNYKSDTKSEIKAKQKRHRSDTINKNDKNEKNTSAKAEGNFSLEEEINKFRDKKSQKHVRIVGWFFAETKPNIPTLSVFKKEASRWMKDASILADYDDKQILRTYQYVKEKFPDDWNLSTIRKYITKTK